MGKIFPTNQNRQFYVASAVGTVSDTAAVGTIAVDSIGEGASKEIFFEVKGASTVLRSDRILLKNLDYAKAVPASAMQKKLKKVTITLDGNVNGGTPVSGQDYILKINFPQFYGSGVNNSYAKDAVVHATSSMTAAAFYEAMEKALNLTFSRELGSTKTSNPYLIFSSSADGLVIEEKEQKEWHLGTMSLQRTLFEVQPTTVYIEGDDVIWGVVTDNTASNTNVIKNGRQTAELEWFCMGERGDQYRLNGYPNYIPTKYLVDETKEYNYLELHYAFTDTGVNSYRSEKDITIVAEDASVLNELIGAINSVADLNIATI